jgi:hypothetical protein
MFFFSSYRASSILYQIAMSNKGCWIIPDNVCHVVMATLVLAGCKPIVLDVDEQTLELNHCDVLQKIKENNLIKGVVMVRTFGNDKLDYSKLINDIKKIDPQISVVDDRCLCEPIFRIADCQADYYLYSTGYSKFVDIGFGGYCFSKVEISNSNLFYSGKHEVEFNNFFNKIIGNQIVVNQNDIFNVCKLNWLNVKTLGSDYLSLVQEEYSKACAYKQNINNVYSNIRQDLVLGNEFNSWRFNLLLGNRDEIFNLFIKNDIFSSKHYFSVSQLLGLAPNNVWNFYSKHIINLFNDRRCSVRMASKSVEIINKYGRPLE